VQLPPFRTSEEQVDVAALRDFDQTLKPPIVHDSGSSTDPEHGDDAYVETQSR
jgi:hypothetical protein